MICTIICNTITKHTYLVTTDNTRLQAFRHPEKEGHRTTTPATHTWVLYRRSSGNLPVAGMPMEYMIIYWIICTMMCNTIARHTHLVTTDNTRLQALLRFDIAMHLVTTLSKSNAIVEVVMMTPQRACLYTCRPQDPPEANGKINIYLYLLSMSIMSMLCVYMSHVTVGDM